MLFEQWTAILKVIGWENDTTTVRLLHDIAEGTPIGNSLLQGLSFPKNSEFRKRTHSFQGEKEKLKFLFPGQPTIL
jgi:hypothetical protein